MESNIYDGCGLISPKILENFKMESNLRIVPIKIGEGYVKGILRSINILDFCNREE